MYFSLHFLEYSLSKLIYTLSIGIVYIVYMDRYELGFVKCYGIELILDSILQRKWPY